MVQNSNYKFNLHHGRKSEVITHSTRFVFFVRNRILKDAFAAATSADKRGRSQAPGGGGGGASGAVSRSTSRKTAKSADYEEVHSPTSALPGKSKYVF